MCHEFAEGAVVSVNGWLLSFTEARLYALVALSVSGFDDDSRADGTSDILCRRRPLARRGGTRLSVRAEIEG
jgi:hypothetical protein